MPLSAIQAVSYVKKKIKNFDPTRVHFYRAGSTLQIVVATPQGRLKVIETYPEKSFLDTLMPKLAEVCDGRVLDETTYWKVYSSERDIEDKLLKAPTMRFDVDFAQQLPEWDEEYRKNEGFGLEDYSETVVVQYVRENFKGDIGFKEVPKTDNWVTPNVWLAKMKLDF